MGSPYSFLSEYCSQASLLRQGLRFMSQSKTFAYYPIVEIVSERIQFVKVEYISIIFQTVR